MTKMMLILPMNRCLTVAFVSFIACINLCVHCWPHHYAKGLIGKGKKGKRRGGKKTDGCIFPKHHLKPVHKKPGGKGARIRAKDPETETNWHYSKIHKPNQAGNQKMIKKHKTTALNKKIEKNKPKENKEETDCGSEPLDFFESTLIFEEIGFFDFRSQLFLDIYNNITASNCGPESLILDSADALPESVNPGLTVRRRKLDRSRRHLIRVTGRCRGCGGRSRAFNDSRRRRRRLAENGHPFFRIHESSFYFKPLARQSFNKYKFVDSSSGNETICNCPAPLLGDFTFQYNRAIAPPPGPVVYDPPAIKGVGELEEVDCSSEVSTFESEVRIQHFGDPEAVTPQEIDTLVQAYKETYNLYNALSFELCDPLFRVIDTVEIDLASVRNRRLQNASRSFAYLYRTRGRCRGCGNRSRSFSEGRRNMITTFRVEDRLLQESLATCLCAPNVEDRAPSEAEFQSAFNSKIQGLVEILLLDNVVSVESVVDVTL